MAQVEIRGWTRTGILGVGALLGVLAAAAIIHVAKKQGWVLRTYGPKR